MAFGKKKKDGDESTETKAARPAFYDSSRSLHRLLPCIFLIVGVLIGVLFAFEWLGWNTAISGFCKDFLFLLFGYASYALPIVLIYIGIRWRGDIEKKRAISRCVYYALFLVAIQAIVWCFSADKSVSLWKNFWSLTDEYATNGTGLISGLIAHLLFWATSYVGVPLFVTALIVTYFFHFLNITPHKIVTYFREKQEEKAALAAESAANESPREDDSDLTDDTNNEDKQITVKKETKEEKRARKLAEKEAKREAKKKAKQESHSDDGFDGYFPTADGEESFNDIRRRMEQEAKEIERERVRDEILAHNEMPASTAAFTPAESMPVEEETYFTDMPVAPSYPAYAPNTSDVPSQSADAVFGAFDPLAGDAVINTTSTILRPAGVPNETRRENVRPVNNMRREEYHSVPGGIEGTGGSVGTFRITPTPHKAPAPAPVAPEIEDEAPVETHTLSDFEMLTRRTEPEAPAEPSLPYVHPATQPSTQPQPQQPIMPPQGYPYGMPPYGQPAYPYPQGYPAQPMYPYPPQPYPNYPYPPMQGGMYPQQPAAPTPAQPVAPVQPESPATPIGEIRIEHSPDTDRSTPVDSTAHVVEHNIGEASVAPTHVTVTNNTPTPAPKKTMPNYDNHHFPPISLLDRSVPITNMHSQSEIDDTSARLVNEFRKFKINIEVKEVTVGPRVTRYNIVPPDGVRINTLTGLAVDIALGLAVQSIRINPVPNTPYLGVEIPNRSATTVRLSSLIDTESFRNAKTVTTIPIGSSVTGQPVFADIAKMPHVLIAGATGMGKSVFMNSLLLSLLYKARPDEVKLILVDPKRVELSVYNGIPHLIIPTVVEPQKAAGALIWAVGEMERRYHLMEKYGCRNIEGYNQSLAQHPERGEHQPKIIIVIDELNDLMMQARDAVEPAIMSIAQKARAAGIHLIIGTQRPSVDVITGVIKANIPSRIAFHVSSGTDSRTILDAYGAEKLLNNGDMLAIISGAEPIRVQGAFVADDEVERVTSFLKDNAGPAVYDEIINAQIESETENYKNRGKKQGDRDMDEEDLDGSIFEDSKFMEACHVALESGKISTSLLQRRCSIGYGKAAKYIDIMQSMGIVSAPDGQKPREVLMSRDQFMEMVSRESYTDDD